MTDLTTIYEKEGIYLSPEQDLSSEQELPRNTEIWLSHHHTGVYVTVDEAERVEWIFEDECKLRDQKVERLKEDLKESYEMVKKQIEHANWWRNEKCLLDDRFDDEQRAWEEERKRLNHMHESVVEGLREELESKRNKCGMLQKKVDIWQCIAAMGCFLGILSWLF